MQKLRFDAVAEQPLVIVLKNQLVELPLEQQTVSLNGELTVRRAGEKNIILNRNIRGDYSACCSRCGRNFPAHFEEEFEYRILLGQENFSAGEIECQNEDVEILYVQEPEIDMEDILREQIYLNLPMQDICDSACLGKCTGCGVNLNEEKCSCECTISSSPFAVLEKLKK